MTKTFQRDIHGRELGIPWVAVADLLLSSLVCGKLVVHCINSDGLQDSRLLKRKFRRIAGELPPETIST